MVPSIAVCVVEEEVPEEGALDEDFAVVGVTSKDSGETRLRSYHSSKRIDLLVHQYRPYGKRIVERVVRFVQEANVRVATRECSSPSAGRVLLRHFECDWFALR